MMIAIPQTPDLSRMRREVGARLRETMTAQGVDVLVLLGNSNVTYATGASWPLGDWGLAHDDRPVAVVLASDDWPHLFLPFSEGLAHESALPADHIHPPVYLEFDEGVEKFAAVLADLAPAGAAYAVDELTGAMRRNHERLFRGQTPADGVSLMAMAKLIKTPDELACLRIASRITAEAMVDIDAAVAPGVRQIDLSARFVRRSFELGATAYLLDPIWEVMPPSRAEQEVWTPHGDLSLPRKSTERELARGDVLWTDVSITYEGYCSDFGRTWCVGQDPAPRQQAQFRRWREILDAVLAVLRAGVTAADLTRAAIEANGGERPWVEHFYLGHGLGVDAAELPFVGTDLGQAFDENQVLQAGSVLVLEPIAWADNTGGFRAEEIFVITDDGYIQLTDYPYHPYGD
ncbi:M24 family metallopeptidase [Fodinicola acaciae]|uniref:M24 family metallopeptidase n=1 Tax=Fodinicola acaciae TaxID=2681555 RepID=UPI0013D0BB1F|nr:Xaa-Pro peptidase family protein [Fodinicola acaciae]